MTKAKRKTVSQRFETWWKNSPWLHHMPPDITVENLKTYARLGYANGWAARRRTKR
jgi:hypothetical protein